MTLYSQAARDGWTLELGRGSGIGGSLDANAPVIRLGDSAANQQYRSILSFGTAALPDNAVLRSVTLEIKRAGIVGSNPFSTLGKIAVDIRAGAFSKNPALQLDDYQAPGSANAAMFIVNNPVRGWHIQTLGSAHFTRINHTGPTQFRLRFIKPNNGNQVADFIRFYSGDFGTNPALRPRLVILYTLP